MKILLVGFYYPPLHTIAAGRIEKIVKYLEKNKHEVFVVTRFFDEKQQMGDNMLVGYEESSGLNTDFIQKGNTIYIKYRKKNKYKQRSGFLPPVIKTWYQLRKIDIHHYGWTEDAFSVINKTWGKTGFDLIYSSYGPPAALVLGKWLADKYKIRHVVEFRDAYIDERDKGWIRKQKIRNQEYLLSGDTDLVFSSQGMMDYFSQNFSFTNRKCVVYNGIDDDDQDYAPEDKEVVEEFMTIKRNYKTVLLHTGTIYEGQNIDFFLSGNFSDEVAIVFVGLTRDTHLPQGKYNCKLLPKVKRATSVYLQKQATALLLPVWKNRYTGFSGKLMEYLSSGTPVICSPQPQPDLLPFFEASGNVYVCNSADDWKQILDKLNRNEITGKKVHHPAYFRSDFWMDKLVNFIGE